MTPKVQPAGVPARGEITRLLQEMREGDSEAEEELLARVYLELRALAAYKMAHEPAGQTLQPSDLVQEAWLRLMGSRGQEFPDRAYFFAAAAEAMRRILVENARRKKRLKRGGDLQRIDIEKVELPAPLPDDDLLVLHEALTRLAGIDPEAAQLVKLRFFVGLTHGQAAKELGVSVTTVERTWAFARAWLFREIQKDRNQSA